MSFGPQRPHHALAALLAGLALALAAPAVASAFTLPITGPADAPRMVFDTHMQVTSVCLPVTNPAGGQSILYGQRFADGPVTASTPAIVLVHGIGSSTENWDFSPTWSVARALASAGYLVFSYDRLGYAKSSYFDHQGGGETLTTAAHRAMLHDVVGDVRSGGYQIAPGGDCGAPTTRADTMSQRVIIIGHSAGGWVVAGYPGQYHDVAAMIETDISGSAGGSGSSPLGGNSSGGSFTPDPSHPDYFEFFQTTQNCLDFNTFTPGIVQYVVAIACKPPFLDSPYGEITDLGAMYAQNDASIAMIGPSIPVLLTSGDEDTTDPPSAAMADYAYYKAHCGCDVTQYLLPATAHLFMVHRSLSTWVDEVVTWLDAHHLSGTPGAGSNAPGGGCPLPTGRLRGARLGPLRLGFTRTRARAILPRHRVARHRIDVFCFAGGPGIRAGYGSRGRLRGRIVIALTANHRYALRGVRPGRRLGRAARRLHARAPVRIGRNRWYVVPGRRVDGVVLVRGGVVRQVGVVNRRLASATAARRRLLRTAG